MIPASFIGFGMLSGEVLIFGAAAGLLLIAAGFVSARGRASGTRAGVAEPSIHPADLERIARFELSALTLRGEQLDVVSEVRWVLAAVRSQATARSVRLEAAVRPGLAIWLDPRAFRKLLAETVGQAIAAAPGCKIIVTGGEHGGRAQIAVVHDGAVLPRETVELALRPVTEIVAFHGGTVQVEGRAGLGMTTVIRLPAFVQAPARASAPAPTVAVMPAASSAAAEGAVAEALLGSS